MRQFLLRHVTAIDILAGIIIVILVMGNVFFYLRYDQLRQETLRDQQLIATAHVNTQVLNFTQMFIDKVLRAQGPIDFETRLNLESEVRGLQDQDILQKWQAFTSASTESDAQTAVKELLSVLASKIRD